MPSQPLPLPEQSLKKTGVSLTEDAGNVKLTAIPYSAEKKGNPLFMM